MASTQYREPWKQARWVAAIGLVSTIYGTHTRWSTKATLIYKRAKNLRFVQLLLVHRKLAGTVRCFGIEVADALEISAQTEIWRQCRPQAERYDGQRAAAFGDGRECVQSAKNGRWKSLRKEVINATLAYAVAVHRNVLLSAIF